MKEVITNNAQSATGLLSQAIVSNGMIYSSGFVHMTDDGEMVEGSVQEKLAQVMNNIKNLLESCNSNIDLVVKATIYIMDLSIGPELNKHYVEYFNDPLPAREMVQVSALPLGAETEISVIAEVK